ncbi:hypothetical protein LAWI1_G002808, partial [Lachnellula willkommii]
PNQCVSVCCLTYASRSSSAVSNLLRARTWDSRPSEQDPLSIVITFDEAYWSEVVQSLNGVIRGNNALQGILRDYSRRELSYTNAAITSARGIVELARVKIDGANLHNSLPYALDSALTTKGNFKARIH